MPEPILINLGCGELVGDHWINVDSSPNVLLDNSPRLKGWLKKILPTSSRADKFRSARHLDLRKKKWPFASGSVDGIYGSHVFEHLTREAGEHVLRECFRVLKPGGRLRLLMPCLEDLIEQYRGLKRMKDPLAATEFAQRTLVLPDLPAGPWWYRMYFQLYDKNRHRMFYDRDSLKHYLKLSGFARVTARRHLDSRLPYLFEVEREDRFPGAFCMEAMKPELPSPKRSPLRRTFRRPPKPADGALGMPFARFSGA